MRREGEKVAANSINNPSFLHVLWASWTIIWSSTGETEAVEPIEIDLCLPRVELFNVETNDEATNMDLLKIERPLGCKFKNRAAWYYESVKSWRFKVDGLALYKVIPNTKEHSSKTPRANLGLILQSDQDNLAGALKETHSPTYGTQKT